MTDASSQPCRRLKTHGEGFCTSRAATPQDTALIIAHHPLPCRPWQTRRLQEKHKRQELLVKTPTAAVEKHKRQMFSLSAKNRSVCVIRVPFSSPRKSAPCNPWYLRPILPPRTSANHLAINTLKRGLQGLLFFGYFNFPMVSAHQRSLLSPKNPPPCAPHRLFYCSPVSCYCLLFVLRHSRATTARRAWVI